MSDLAKRPHRLDANHVPVYYRGGEKIDRFRGTAGNARGPEDWVGSVTAFPPELLPPGANPGTGISSLPDGSSLREAIQAEPEQWLGVELARAFDGEPGLLVKLLDAGERLPVHCHPSREVARAKLGSRFGKTEGWIIMSADPGASIWLGFREEVDLVNLREWVERQDGESMLEAMNPIEVAAGDVYYLPAGLPHSIGAGVMLTELQEPTSFSILAEYAAFGLSTEQATLGLGWEDALACFDRRAHSPSRLERLRPKPEPVADNLWQLFPEEAAPFFQAYRGHVRGRLALEEESFAVLIVERGSAALSWESGREEVADGETWVAPYGAGPLALEGDLDLIVCLPPRPAS